jgi:hypothetical protein
MSFELINLTDWPSMPAPMQSKDSGEAWVWGDFFAVLQKEPMIVAQGMQAMTGNSVTKSPMDYPYAMTVFYDKAKNPHGPSSRPVLCVALEQSNLAGLAAMLGGDSKEIESIGGGAAMPMMIGVFTAAGRMNLGEYSGPLTADAARTRFFEIVKQQLSLHGDPVRIGAIDAVYGHPNTGWPAATKNSKGQGKAGCSAMLCLLVMATICVGAILKNQLPNKAVLDNRLPDASRTDSANYTPDEKPEPRSR